MKHISIFSLLLLFLNMAFGQGYGRVGVSNSGSENISKNNESNYFSIHENPTELNSKQTEKIIPGTISTSATCCCDDSIKNSSFIINMGVTPQTVNNGLKPYGMLYDLITNYSVPIVWSINPTKTKDGSDFTHNAVTYRGGTFIVPAQYITPSVSARIAFWIGQGVSGNYSTTTILPPVFDTLTSFPKIMIDNDGGNQGILAGYYTLAGIPAGAYTVGNPAGLGSCYDVWTAPHSDPTWATHSYLYNFVTTRKGWIWAECHSVSVLESCMNPSFPFNSLHFLSTAGLQCFNAGSCNGIGTTHAGNPTAPFTYYYPNDPVMQFMSTMDGASQNGSEKWFIPIAAGQWYTKTQRAVTTADGVSPREGVELVYGPAFGNSANGMVMYEGGHDITTSGTVANQVSAVRAYFNFILWAGLTTRLNVSVTSPTTMASNTASSVSATVTTGSAPYTYAWSSTIAGTFSSTTISNPTFTPSLVSVDTTGVIKVVVTDNCGRKNLETKCVSITAGPLPVELLSISVRPAGKTALLEWTTASEINNDHFQVERSSNAIVFDSIGIVSGHGTTTETNNYQFIDYHPFDGLSYYRLAQTDFDGAVEMSPVVYLRMNKDEIQNVVVYPNPVMNDLYFSLFSNAQKTGMIRVINTLGEIVIEQKADITKGDNLVHCDKTSGLSAGVYFIKINLSEDESYTVRFVKE